MRWIEILYTLPDSRALRKSTSGCQQISTGFEFNFTFSQCHQKSPILPFFLIYNLLRVNKKFLKIYVASHYKAGGAFLDCF